MSKHHFYQIDAFTSRLFAGNPAGVCQLDDWLPDATLVNIAAENCLSETAFYVPRTNGFDLRWFNRKTEVDLCGHATLAAAFVLYKIKGFSGQRIQFHTRSGMLEVTKQQQGYAMLLPAQKGNPLENSPADLFEGLGGISSKEVYKSRDYMVVLPTERDVALIKPDFQKLELVETTGIIVTAPGDKADFVSRYFAPRMGIPEDSVSGSAHCALTPYWSERLGKVEMQAHQISPRGGEIICHFRGSHVMLVGNAQLYLEGQIHVPGES
jgi:PhzF family phenazine biosynthesis protein